MIPITFFIDSSVAQDSLIDFQLPGVAQTFTYVYGSVCAQSFTGTPTAFTVDINDDGTAIDTITASTAGTPGTGAPTKAEQREATNQIAGDSVISLDFNFTGGSTPAANDVTILLWFLIGG